MAQLEKRRSENKEGAFYVDTSCIDCDTCRWLAPAIFDRAGDQSYVYHQPETEAEKINALEAMLACPTTSIGNQERSALIATVRDSFPLKIDESVYYCGYHSAKSYGAASYLVQHPDGNILIDSPRYNGPLLHRLEALGGVRYMFLTHKDDIADHQLFADAFGCERIMYKADITDACSSIERQLEGDEAFVLNDDIKILPVPGHTQGSAVLLAYNKFLFTGDHLAWSARLKQLYAFKNYCWYDWDKQIESMRSLQDYSFEWILPGHGRRFQAQLDEMQTALQQCIDWMETEDN